MIDISVSVYVDEKTCLVAACFYSSNPAYSRQQTYAIGKTIEIFFNENCKLIYRQHCPRHAVTPPKAVHIASCG